MVRWYANRVKFALSLADKHYLNNSGFHRYTSVPINRILMMAANITVEDVIHRVNRRMDGIRRIIRTFIAL